MNKTPSVNTSQDWAWRKKKEFTDKLQNTEFSKVAEYKTNIKIVSMC